MMALSPREIDRLDLREFHAMFDGFAAMNGAKSEDDDMPSPDEFYAAMAREMGRA